MTLPDLVDAIVAFVTEHRHWAAPVVFALALGESIAFVSLLLPFWGLLVAIGALVGLGGPEIVLLWVAASLGAALGDWVSYAIGAAFKDRVWHAWPLSRYPALRPKGHAFFERWGAWAIVIGRFSGPLRASVPLVAGALQMPWLSFQIANFASAFLWAGVLLVFGDGVGRLIGLARGWLGL